MPEAQEEVRIPDHTPPTSEDVVDFDLPLAAALVNGIGKGRAYGAGLLTVEGIES